MTAPGDVRFSRGKSLGFVLMLVVGFFAVAEGTLRVVGIARPVSPRMLLRQMDTDITLPFIQADDDVFWSPQPGFKGDFKGWRVTINSLGLRGPEVRTERSSAERRVVCLGDSITFGYGVGDDETYPFHLGRVLAANHVEVLNGGVTGFTSHQVLGHLRRLLPVLRPDVVTVCIGWNDSNLRDADDREYARRLALAREVDSTFDRFRLYRVLKAAYLRARVRRAMASRTVARVSHRQYRENLRAIVSETRGADVRPVFIGLPQRKDPAQPSSSVTLRRNPTRDGARAPGSAT